MRVLTGLTPSGHLTLGNYLGALKPLKKLLKKGYEIFIFIANTHGMSIPSKITPLMIRKNTIELLLVLEAMGLSNSVDNCYVYIQSDHSNNFLLSLLTQSFSYIGELERMTQFKNKQQQLKIENKTKLRPTGLLTYPILMAADILLYSPDIVPVGGDQKQHLELTRTICTRMNRYFQKDLIKLPLFQTPKIGSRIKSLTNPEKKMSKSDINKNSSIFLLDNENVIKFKFAKAYTDSKNTITQNYNNTQLWIKNFFQINKLLVKNLNVEELIKKINNSSVPYKYLKDFTAKSVIKELIEIQTYIKHNLKLDYLSIESFEHFIENNPKWIPKFVNNQDWKRKNKKILSISNSFINSLLRILELKIY